MTVPVLECYRSVFRSNSTGYSGKCNNPFKKLDHNICKITFLKIIFDINTMNETKYILYCMTPNALLYIALEDFLLLEDCLKAKNLPGKKSSGRL